MKPRIHRTPEMKARAAVLKRVRSQEELDQLLAQFRSRHHAGILERLKPHLPFEPKPRA